MLLGDTNSYIPNISLTPFEVNKIIFLFLFFLSSQFKGMYNDLMGKVHDVIVFQLELYFVQVSIA